MENMKIKWDKKNWPFPTGIWNPGFLNKFPPKIWILREIRLIELTVLKKSWLYLGYITLMHLCSLHVPSSTFWFNILYYGLMWLRMHLRLLRGQKGFPSTTLIITFLPENNTRIFCQFCVVIEKKKKKWSGKIKMKYFSSTSAKDCKHYVMGCGGGTVLASVWIFLQVYTIRLSSGK